MGNSVMRQTVFRASWWTKDCRRDGRDNVQVETISQPLEERREHRAVGTDNLSCGGDGLQDTSVVMNGGREDAVGHQLVGRYFTDWYNAPQNVWRYYTEDAVCSLDVDGTRYVATGRTEIRKLFNDVAAPETGNHEDDDDECRTLVVQSIVTVRCPSGQLLVVATTEWFTQTFVVEYTAPHPAVAGVASVAVVASVVTLKRVGAYLQTPETPIRRRRRRRCRRGKDATVADSRGADADAAVAFNASGECGRPAT
ncbi:adenosine kinase-like [Aphis craccivora]|uniref:Adenosine kinase-like n=1 Tax=Aphis craccivora TaxID=307492 RepID=A0A6G0Y7P4_APHCR|nr:adenosine kinase-like [Aphis craccivora]